MGLRQSVNGSALPNPHNPLHVGSPSRGFHGSHLLRPASLLALLYGSDRSPSRRGLLLPGFQRGRPVAGYNYSSGWTPLLAGLSPAGTTARLAAPQTTTYRTPSLSGRAQCAFWAHDLPVPTRESLADAGGPLAYGAPLRKAARHMAPRGQDTQRFWQIEVASDQDLAINLSTARHLGVKVSPELLTQADQTIK
jgi:hypothetical protein